jgi:probable DNA metabolism protein
MRTLYVDGTFAGWREVARQALLQGLAPHQLHWQDADSCPGLFDHGQAALPASTGHLRVPAQLLQQLECAARYRGEARWSLLYRVLWRVVHGQRSAALAGDPDGSELQRRIKAVRREAHHLHAFVRFQPAPAASEVDLLAWFEPRHDLLAWASRHFSERLGQQRWLIATPADGVHWDGQRLHHHRHCPRQWQVWATQPDSEGQALWQAYYSSTFNPARVNPRALKQHLPSRLWRHLPEGTLIPQLINQARHGAQHHSQAPLLLRRPGKRIAPPDSKD